MLEMIGGGCRIAEAIGHGWPRDNAPRTTRDAPSTRSDNGPARPPPATARPRPPAGTPPSSAGADRPPTPGHSGPRARGVRAGVAGAGAGFPAVPAAATPRPAPAPPGRAASRRENRAAARVRGRVVTTAPGARSPAPGARIRAGRGTRRSCANHRHRGRCSKPDDERRLREYRARRPATGQICRNRNTFDSVSSQRWASLARAFSRSEDWTAVQTASVLTAATTSDSAPATTARRRRRAQRSTPNRQCGSRAKASGRSLHQRSRSSASSEARL